jgi:8-oxo-dGTP pyrophosphatase MutT (NUDIX family)
MKFIKIAHQLLKVAWRITKPITQGARVLIVKDGDVLLVKHAYQDHYFLPGGMVKKGETFEQTAKRELKEEVGIELGELRLFGVYNNFYEYKNDGIVVFLCESFQKSHGSDHEIESFDFFPMTKLPANISSGTKRRINEYRMNSFPTYGLW